MSPRLPRRLRAGAAAALLLAAGIAGWSASGPDEPEVRRADRFLRVARSPGSAERVSLDTSYFTGPGTGRRPAVLLAHGFGGSKTETRGQAEQLARDGYAVLTWSARGFGNSGDRIGLNAPDREIADVRRLIDWLAGRPEVLLDRPGDPRVGITGVSYGGGAALLTAAQDRRVDAIAPQLTWWNLADVFFPQYAGDASANAGADSGVFKKMWAGVFFGSGADPAIGGADPACGRFRPEVCRVYRTAATTGRPDRAALRLLRRSSPSAVAERITVPTLIVQGRRDSLFPLDQGDAMARAIHGNGAVTAVDWTAGGHDGGSPETGRLNRRVNAWFDRHLKRERTADPGPAFRVSRDAGVDTAGRATLFTGASTGHYPGLSGLGRPRTLQLRGPAQPVANPPGGTPAAVSGVPGLPLPGRFGAALGRDLPGQAAHFDSEPLDRAIRITGSPTVRVNIGIDDAADRDTGAVLFAKLYDLAPDGRSTLPEGLANPLRVTTSGPVRITLPAVDLEIPAGHRLRLALATTDLAYATPVQPAVHTVSLPADQTALTLPNVPELHDTSRPLPWWTWALPAGAALAALLLLLLPARRRRHSPASLPHDPELADIPLVITDLGKRYRRSGERWAVRELSFRVEAGQVLGLLGPNGAGKTTTLRMLMGLVHPDTGGIRVLGHAVRPGAPVLSRVGAFVEGPGFLPHLSGRANLDLYWRATGRPAADAHLDEALETAALGPAADRPVRTYSQGMRQRLAIAQAMLGRPELLILDEPTNGLDPPQIHRMRQVLRDYARTGRTVIISSHLLAEVEQTCTHLVVMEQGRLVAAGPTGEIAGADGALLVATTDPVAPALREELEALDGIAEVRPAEEGIIVRLDGMTTPELVAELVRRGVPVERIGPNRRLEEAFLSLIGGAL